MNTRHSSLVTRHVLAAAALLLVSGCTNVSYYWQSANGQLDVWRRGRPIDEVIADPATAPAVRDKLARAIEMRAFASRELGLPDNQSYRRYADIQRPFVVWNVFAAAEFSVRPLQWCFPVVGCVAYRGYFAKEEAERFAAELEKEGYEVFVGGVPAYSTLGWFADPVLSTVIQYTNPHLARLIFHELAHQVVYARGDTNFNESFAVTVEREGVNRWLKLYGTDSEAASYARAVTRRDEFIELIRAYRRKLRTLYDSGLAPARMRETKKELFAELGREYQKLKAGWGGFSGYDIWFAKGVNNAHLVSIAVYTRWVPAFEALLARDGGDLKRFYESVRQLSLLPKDERDARLTEFERAAGK